MIYHLWTSWPEIKSLMIERRVFLCLDFDGTLTPIVRHPDLAKLSLAQKKLLESLAAIRDLKVAIVSGRSLKDLKERVGVNGFIYAGNHGLELEGPRIQYVHPEALAATKLLEELSLELNEHLKCFPGIFVEQKIFTLGVHYRALPPKKIQKAKHILMEVLKPYLDSSQLMLTEGKKVWEVQPMTQWNKGKIVLWLLAREAAVSSGALFPVYVGDDQTDENVFKVIGRRGLGLKVTEDPLQPTYASYYLCSPKDVFAFLKRLETIEHEKEKEKLRAAI